jgi:glycosyltransferase involved in cell wall biosynthesis
MIYRGISIIVFCYNSEKIIGTTLSYLKEQFFSAPVEWEVLLIDNNSTDSTITVAHNTWESLDTNTPLRICEEQRQGLNYARERGVTEAKYEYIIFCDDDNWLFTNYAQTAFDLMESDTALAAIGGLGHPVFEDKEPWYFRHIASSFAVGKQQTDAKNRAHFLYGAGLVVRKSVFEKLKSSGYTSVMTDRQGLLEVTSGGDYELTIMFRILGYELQYSPDLCFYHYIDQRKLNWPYLKKLYESFGVATALLIPHQIVAKNKGWIAANLYFNLMASCFTFLKRALALYNEKKLVQLELYMLKSHFKVALASRSSLPLTIKKIYQAANTPVSEPVS